MMKGTILMCLLKTCFIFGAVEAMIKLVGPDETTEDLTKPISQEREMSWYRFRTYFKDGNTQFRVLDISRKYYDAVDRNITYQEFVKAGKEYVIEDMCLNKMHFKSIAKIIPRLNEAFSQWLHEKKNQSFSLQEYFQHSVQGQFKSYLKGFLAFKDQPWEVQQRLIHELEDKKRKNPHHHHGHELHHEEAYISGKYNGYGKNLTMMRQEELQRRFQQEYGGLEWTDDGRRVIDEDYDAEAPSENRTLHQYRIQKDNLTQDQVDELLMMELDL